MFNVSIYDVDIMIKTYHEGKLVAKATQNNTAWLCIDIDDTTNCFNLLGVSQMAIDFVGDDYIVFKKWRDGDHVDITISKKGISRMIGGLLEYLAKIAPSLSLFDLDDE